MKKFFTLLLLLFSASAFGQGTNITVRDNEFRIVSGADTTKRIYFDVSALSPNSERGYRLPSIPASPGLLYGSAFYPATGTVLTHAMNGVVIGSRIGDNGQPLSPFTINASAAQVVVNGNQINLNAGDVLSLSAENGVRVNSPMVLRDNGTKPTCDEEQRGKIWTKFGESEAEDDTVEICNRRGGVWAWRSLL